MNYSIKKIEKKKRKIEEEYYFPKTSRKQKKIQVEISNIIELQIGSIVIASINRVWRFVGKAIPLPDEIVAGQFSKAEIPLYALPLIPLVPPMNLDAEKCAPSSQKHPRW